MYLEISPRRTGKSTRLIKAVQEWIATEKNVALMFPHNHSWARELGKSIGERPRDSVEFVYGSQNFYNLMEGCDRTKNFKVFVDEFDFIQWFPVDREGYYATTPKQYRSKKDIVDFMLGEKTDPMLDLIQMNDGKYEQYSPMSWMKDMSITQLKDMEKMYEREHYQQEFFGNAFK